mmetsp:Transcript_883/g.2782  ORF Transcript_883/g.2782 Transcript_883/m.2782 type:complete len:110 (+) Transcript_883:169-498(+)
MDTSLCSPTAAAAAASSSSPPSSSSKHKATASTSPLHARATPAKSVASVVPISEETGAILKRKTGQTYLTSAELPPQNSVCRAAMTWWTSARSGRCRVLTCLAAPAWCM